MKDVGEIEHAAEIAAAEERGRRSAETERDELLIEARDCLNYAHAELRKAGILGEAAQVEQMIDRIDAAFAPRDSAPACDAVLSSDPFREWRCGKPKGHEGPHSGEAPRDSGEEGP